MESSSSTTTAAVVLGKATTNNNHSTYVVVWIFHSDKNALEYFEIYENSSWMHLDALLMRFAPQSVHLLKQQNEKKLLEKLIQMLEERHVRHDREDNDEASFIQVHSTLPKYNTGQLQSMLKDMLSDQAAYQVAADSHLFSGSVIQQGLVLLLQACGLWGINPDDQTSFTLSRGTLDSALYLDRTAATAIHLWPPKGMGQTAYVGGTAQNNSVFGILAAATSTGNGPKLLESWLRQPLVHLEPILQRQEAVAALVQANVERDALKSQGLHQFKSTNLYQLSCDLAHYSREQANDQDDDAVATGSTRKALQTLYALYLVSAQKLPILAELLEQVKSESEILLHCEQQIQQAVADLRKAVDLAEAVLDLDQAPREFLVRASYKQEFSEIHNELSETEQEIEACHEAMNIEWARATGTATGAVRLERSEWQFRLPNTNDSKILQSQFADTVRVHRLLKNGVYFSTKELRELACKYQDLVTEYDRHQREIVLDALAVASTYSAVIGKVSQTVALLDVLTAMAHVASHSLHGYCRPLLTDSEEVGQGIVLKGARHPCVELQEDIDFIPNDVNLKFGESSFLIVTGPNMGGKSTYIRALGAIVTMAQIGCFVPCTSATINVCHHILARVGAGDLQERGISTFMAEMLESASILRMATKRSLIIIDELGRGTSTYDGYGLARAISEYIIEKIGCMTVFATHFHELTAIEEEQMCVKNCHVTAQRGSQGLTFLYAVKRGPCLESFGIQVAEMAQVPAIVIENAKRKAKALENFEYRKKQHMELDTFEDEHEQAEQQAAAVAWLNRFKQLPASILTAKYSSDDEKRAAIIKFVEG